MLDSKKITESFDNTIELYLMFLRSEFDKLWEDAILRVLEESSWTLTTEESTRKTSFVWLFLYDYTHACGKSLRSNTFAKQMFKKVTKELKVDTERLLPVLNEIHRHTPDGVFRHIYKIVDDNFALDQHNNSNVRDGFIFMQNKVYENGYLNQVLTTELT